MKYTPHHYQEYATQKIIDNNSVGLLLDMGLGKTVSSATAIDRLLFDDMKIKKPLIIAPKFVAENTWPDELQKWDHLKHLRISIIAGRTERSRKEALRVKADVYIISWDNIAWLVIHYGTAFPFDMLVLDESSKVKNPKSQRFKALKQIRAKVKRCVLLTGTPTPNGLLDLWSQVYLLDGGARLGDTFTKYRNTYFSEGRRKGFVVYDYKLKKEQDDIIHAKIADICVSMKASDYLDLPKRLDQTVKIKMPDELREKYNTFERELVLSFGPDEVITAANAAVLSNKLLQFANGAIYNLDKTYRDIHDLKIQALIEDVEAANGSPLLVFYQFQHDLARILHHLKSYKPEVLKSGKDSKSTIERWNNKGIAVMAAHAASAGHGLNLQYGGHLIDWFGCGWSLELDEQGVHRIDRQGQTEVVINRRLVMEGTMDEDVLFALENKAHSQNALLAAVKARIEKHRRNI